MRLAHPERADGKSAAERLGHRDAVRQECVTPGNAFEDSLETLEPARAIVSALHAVQEQQQFLFIAQRAQAEQIFRRRGDDTALALDAFDQDGRRRRGDCGPRRREVVVRHMPETRDHRLEALLHLVLAGGGDAGERAAVKRIERGEDFEAAFVVPELAGELVKSFVRLRAAVAKKHLAGRQAFDDLLRQPALRLVIIKVRDMEELARLLRERVRNLGVRVAERADGDAAAEIEVTLAVHVPQVTAAAVAEGEFEAAVARHHVLLEQLFDARLGVVHDGGRRNDFFHGKKFTGGRCSGLRAGWIQIRTRLNVLFHGAASVVKLSAGATRLSRSA